jgi:hypothetical protein
MNAWQHLSFKQQEIGVFISQLLVSNIPFLLLDELTN